MAKYKYNVGDKLYYCIERDNVHFQHIIIPVVINSLIGGYDFPENQFWYNAKADFSGIYSNVPFIKNGVELKSDTHNSFAINEKDLYLCEDTLREFLLNQDLSYATMNVEHYSSRVKAVKKALKKMHKGR